MAKMETRYDNFEEHWFRCDCGDTGHILSIEIEDDEFPLLTICDSFRPPRWFGERGRLWAVWQILRGRNLTVGDFIINGETRDAIVEVLAPRRGS